MVSATFLFASYIPHTQHCNIAQRREHDTETMIAVLGVLTALVITTAFLRENDGCCTTHKTTADGSTANTLWLTVAPSVDCVLMT